MCLSVVLLLSAVSSFSAYAEEKMTESRILPCPDTPNCVSSKATSTAQHIDPLRYEGDKDEAWLRLIKIVKGMKRAEVVEDSGAYIHATFKSWLFRFVDDVEFQIDDDAKIIHMKSSSRVGYSDFGVNRRRCETIRAKFDR